MRRFLRVFKPRSRSGLTLVEILIASWSVLLLAAAMIPAVWLGVVQLERLLDERRAALRCELALSLLRDAVLHCGYGMPAGVASFRESFAHLARSPFDWEGPVSVLDARGGAREGAELRLLYAAPSNARVLAFERTGSFDCRLSLNVPLGGSARGAAIANSRVADWLLFGEMCPRSVPLCIRAFSATRIELVSAVPLDGLEILPGERLFVLSALRAWSESGVFYTDDCTGSGRQPRVQGVVDARFAYDPPKSQLSVWVLARGDLVREHSHHSIPASWPEAFRASLSQDATRYRLVARTAVWKIANLEP